MTLKECPYSPSTPLFPIPARTRLKLISFPSTRFRQKESKNNIRMGTCRSYLADDAPFAAAIGACMLSSLVFPVKDKEDGESAMDSTDARFAVMGIISFIPYFNWLSWVFAWIDTGKRRYAVYALVYLIPYLRSNLSLSPDESWLPIASIIFCIVHIQLEVSIRNGDIQGFLIFREVGDHLPSRTRKEGYLKEKQKTSKQGTERGNRNLPSAENQSGDIGSWEDLNEHFDNDDRSKH